MEIHANPFNTYTDQEAVGIGIQVYSSQGGASNLLHIGILYYHQNDDDSWCPKFCHLYGIRGPNLINQHVEQEMPQFWVKTSISRLQSIAVGAYCRAVCDPKNNTNIPYGFSLRDGLLGVEGELRGKWLGEPGDGLTCATFVLCIFRGLNIDILKINSWDDKPEEDKRVDDIWRDSIASALPKQVQERFIAGKISSRYRPEEVAVGANSPDRPLDYSIARELGDQMLEKLSQIIRCANKWC